MKKVLTLLIFSVLLLVGCGDTKPDATNKHNYVPTVTDATCDEAGYTTYTCDDCGDSYVSDIVEALGHGEELIQSKEPTCTEDGNTEGLKCPRCELVFEQPGTIPARGHDYDDTVIEPTCDEVGYTLHVCIICEHSYKDAYVNAKGHTWDTDSCTECGDSREDPGDTPAIIPTLTVTYVDVGQGDCIFIKLGDCDILIDAGKPDRGTDVSNYLKSLAIDDIELMINTHLDNDHYGGLPQVLKDFTVEAFWGTPYQKSGSTITSLKNDITAEGITYDTPAIGTQFTYYDLTLTVIYDGVGATNSNDSSLVVMLEYGEHKFLFTGDIGQKVEAKLVSGGTDLACDVLKVGHHGSRTSSTLDFLRATGAKYGVICVGTGNSYGHPTSTALTNLATAGITVYRTDLSGHIIFTTDGTTLNAPSTTSSTAVAAVTEVVIIPEAAEMLKKRYLVGAVLSYNK